jgi:radical SAM superfamily enzyme YgiQ (UPF0313 family)
MKNTIILRFSLKKKIKKILIYVPFLIRFKIINRNALAHKKKKKEAWVIYTGKHGEKSDKVRK